MRPVFRPQRLLVASVNIRGQDMPREKRLAIRRSQIERCNLMFRESESFRFAQVIATEESVDLVSVECKALERRREQEANQDGVKSDSSSKENGDPAEDAGGV